MNRKTILVTGASRGIGRATALQAGSLGWAVGVNYARDEAAAETVAAEIERAGGRALPVKADIAREEEVLELFETVAAALGPLDGAVVNAGIVAPAAPLVEMSAERMRRIFDVNVLGTYLCAREAARRLAQGRGGKGGSIVIVSSAAARTGAPFEYVDYAGAKGAADALTLGLAKELGPEGVRVNAVRPALIETGIHASGGRPDRAQVLGAGTPLGRAGRPEEVAEAIVWLLGDASSYVSGSFVELAGGR
ncbi:SDR family oxidoreductase [Propylenella binzhouense]|uniref:SDR family oxidoreductase n=1 Tax=Propylenella binzhouense TaxID=2555902 RepID=A0A964T898_9HYPH|nr:SDR family oxidoreductase [Propylenella binzhouense]MYZ49900.1 SDR family oxidoreductase [Propylenella binzhouense]